MGRDAGKRRPAGRIVRKQERRRIKLVTGEGVNGEGMPPYSKELLRLIDEWTHSFLATVPDEEKASFMRSYYASLTVRVALLMEREGWGTMDKVRAMVDSVRGAVDSTLDVWADRDALRREQEEESDDEYLDRCFNDDAEKDD